MPNAGLNLTYCEPVLRVLGIGQRALASEERAIATATAFMMSNREEDTKAAGSRYDLVFMDEAAD